MSRFAASAKSQKPRELRRRVLLPARARTAAGWSDACILNISSRGLLIHARRPAAQGSIIELNHGQHAIVARVVWADGQRLGLSAEDRLPVEQILSLSQGTSLQLTAVEGRRVERRRRARTHDDSRFKARTMEFVGIAFIALALSSGAFALVVRAFAEPMAQVRVALSTEAH